MCIWGEEESLLECLLTLSITDPSILHPLAHLILIRML